jgi:light-regulated signal transduction histidine kinase (bacteriophytochrome)
MQVGASFSISLLSKDRLWGLIACHSHSAKFIDYNSRIACKFIGQLFSAALEFKSDEVDEANVSRVREQQQLLFEQLLKESDTVDALLKKPVNLLGMTNANGVVYFCEQKMQTLGEVPGQEAVEELVDWIRSNNHESFFQTNTLPLQYKPAREFAGIASGVMIIFLSHDKSEFIAWFKPEKIQSVAWAGEPGKGKNIEEDGTVRISPRKSFEKWTEEVRYTSADWSDIEISGAMKLREDLIQVNNKKAGEIRKLNELLQNAYDELDTFSFTISHDLRTPLSSIRNYTEIILEDHEDKLNPEARELFAKVIRGTDKMAQLIRNVLQYSRVGRTNIETVPINMKSLLGEIREEVISGVKDREVEIRIGESPDIWGDKTMMLQLFTNLISNAVKYSTNAKLSVVEVEGTNANGFTTYTVKDNGIGIDMKYANRIFELFRRLDNVKNIEGTGVGLAIAKRIVEKHNGKIWLESRPGHGTKFYISLPDNKPENA